MNLTDDVLNSLKCCLNSKEHFLRDPLILKCNHSACKKCIEKKKGREFTCEFNGCGKKYKMKKVDKLQSNLTIPELLETHKIELIELINTEFSKIFINLCDINIENMFDENCDLIENEIDIKIESLKNELDNLGDFMRRKLRGTRDQMKCLIPVVEVEKTKEFLANMKEVFLDSSKGGDLFEFESKLNSCKKRIDIMSGFIPRLPFRTNNLEIEEKHIGDLGDIIYNPPELPKEEEDLIHAATPIEPCKFQQIDNHAYSSGSYSTVSRLIYIENRDELVVTDTDAKCLRVLDALNNNSFILQINPGQVLDCPVAICANKDGDIFVGDYTHAKIFVFDEYLDFKHSFGDGVIHKAFTMTIDSLNDDLYVSDKRNNIISVWNTKTYEHLHDIQCESPIQSKVNNEQIIVACGIDYETFGFGSTRVKRVVKGLNCIKIYNKNTHELEKTIKLEGFADLRGLCIDEYSNIYTTAVEFKHNNLGATFLFKYDKNGNLIKKFPQLNYGGIRDMILYENKIVFTRGNKYPHIYSITFRQQTARN